LDYLTTHTSLSPIWHGFAPGFVSYKKGCTRLAAASNKVYQLLAHGRWFSPGTPASSTTKTCCHDIAEILLKVALNTKNQIKSNKMNCELMLTYDTSAYMFNVYKNQPSRQTGSRNLMGPKTLNTIWGTDMKLVIKYQIPVINSF
jgi:hypothetical protein